MILTANMSSSSASQLTRFDATSCELKNDIIGAMEGLGLAAPSSIVIKKLFDIGQASSDGFCSSSLGSGDTSCRTCPATAPTSPVQPPVYDSTVVPDQQQAAVLHHRHAYLQPHLTLGWRLAELTDRRP